uniref:Uncharacterized protein n=1 Tax=Rhizophora mucronata TaxID=61149 RepID=A0A2P2ML31_RHIMU
MMVVVAVIVLVPSALDDVNNCFAVILTPACWRACSLFINILFMINSLICLPHGYLSTLYCLCFGLQFCISNYRVARNITYNISLHLDSYFKEHKF